MYNKTEKQLYMTIRCVEYPYILNQRGKSHFLKFPEKAPTSHRFRYAGETPRLM